MGRGGYTCSFWNEGIGYVIFVFGREVVYTFTVFMFLFGILSIVYVMYVPLYERGGGRLTVAYFIGSTMPPPAPLLLQIL